jgi:hypothetical protein
MGIADIVTIVIISICLLIILLLLRQLLFFGFVPFLPHRPEIIERILKELNPPDNAVFYSLGYGRSGFLPLAKKRWPQNEFVGVDEGFISFWVSKLQALLKKEKIKILHSDYYKTDLRRANVIYCYLAPEELREMYRKLKVEPRVDAIIISVGFVIPYFDPIKTIKTEPKKTWYNFLIRHKKVLTIKEKEHTRDENIYIYQV